MSVIQQGNAMSVLQQGMPWVCYSRACHGCDTAGHAIGVLQPGCQCAWVRFRVHLARVCSGCTWQGSVAMIAVVNDYLNGVGHKEHDAVLLLRLELQHEVRIVASVFFHFGDL